MGRIGECTTDLGVLCCHNILLVAKLPTPTEAARDIPSYETGVGSPVGGSSSWQVIPSVTERQVSPRNEFLSLMLLVKAG